MDSIPPAELEILKGQTKGPSTLVIVIVFTVLAFVTVVLRFLTRIFIIRNAGIEDYTIGVAMALSIAMAACMIEQVRWGNGKHIMFLTLPDAIGILKYLYWSIFAYCLALTFTKLSILLQYRRIFFSYKRMRIAIYCVMAFVLAYGVESTFSGIFTCTPIRAFWDVTIQPTSKCVDEYSLWYANAGINIATDLAIAILPLPCVAKLQLPTKQKIALMFILAIGWFVCVVSMLRLHALVVLQAHQDDSTYYSAETAWWSCIEVNVAIMCASMPSLRKLVTSMYPRFLAATKEYGSKPGASSGVSSHSKNRKEFLELHERDSPGTFLRSTDTDDRPWERGPRHQMSAEAFSSHDRHNDLESNGIKVTKDVAWLEDPDSDENITPGWRPHDKYHS